MKEQGVQSRLRSRCVVFNSYNKLIEIETLRKNAWTKGLKKAGTDYRPNIQARHALATMMVSSEEKAKANDSIWRPEQGRFPESHMPWDYAQTLLMFIPSGPQLQPAFFWHLRRRRGEISSPSSDSTLND
jgi:hypothetical protein